MQQIDVSQEVTVYITDNGTHWTVTSYPYLQLYSLQFISNGLGCVVEDPTRFSAVIGIYVDACNSNTEANVLELSLWSTSVINCLRLHIVSRKWCFGVYGYPGRKSILQPWLLEIGLILNWEKQKKPPTTMDTGNYFPVPGRSKATFSPYVAGYLYSYLVLLEPGIIRVRSRYSVLFRFNHPPFSISNWTRL